MPDWGLYLQASLGSMVASAVVVFLSGWLGRPAAALRTSAGGIFALGVGLASGYLILRFAWVWPPVKGLDRLLELVLPAALAIEFAAAMPRVSRRLAWCLRIGLAALTGPVLLHGSVYLRYDRPEWTMPVAAGTLLGVGLLLVLTWLLLDRLAQRSSGVSIGVALSMATQCAGATIMLAGYIKGGMAAGPLAATIAATAIASSLMKNRAAMQSTIGVALVGLSGLLLIGRFYGGLRTPGALVTFCAPLLCWATEIRAMRNWKPWQVCALQLTLVAIVLTSLLVLAKRDFDRDFGPLLR
jgi:hypothetical protein